MKRCPSCDFVNPDKREHCLKCSALLDAQAVPDGSHLANRRESTFHPIVAVNQLVSWLSERLTGNLPVDLSHRFPWTAAHLAVIPGLGQIYNHQYTKAGVIIGIYLLLLILFAMTFFMRENDLVAIALAFLFFYTLADAFVTACKINGQPWVWRQLLAVWFAMMFYVGVTLMAAQFLGTLSLFYLTTIRSTDLSPVLERGDKVFVLAPLLGGKPDVGDVIYYDPQPYTMVKPGSLSSNTIIINAIFGFGVVTAAEGEVMAMGNDGVLTIDGIPAEPRRLPINPNGVPRFSDVRVKPGQVGVLNSTPTTVSGGPLSALGGSFGGQAPDPRTAEAEGNILRDYPSSTTVPNDGDDYFGKLVFIYYPPERRRWFGLGNGAHPTEPDGYPTPF